jgi:predicted nucleotidyltransferase component of viral defense system/DNA-directed RNA polymerase subunit RPC12/RpoP
MITRADIVERVREWQLTEEVVEKDYVLGWLLWGFGSDAVLGEKWVFKGGTCLKKCYIETHRFSEDLDFTVLTAGPYRPQEIEPLLVRMLARVHDASGINFSTKAPAVRLRPDGLSTDGRVYYVGPRRTPQAARVKLDISANETVIRPPVLREIAHPYPDGPLRGRVRCYSFEEVFAEKIRAMAQRARPRDLYDIVNLFRRNDLRLYPELIKEALIEMCAAKVVAVPTAADFAADSPLMAALASDWSQMLAHQLPVLPPLQSFVDELPVLFAWLEGSVEFEDLPPLPSGPDEDAWSPPPTVATWEAGIPLETVRFAATNHLCVELRYDGRWRLIEPYSLRRSSAGRLLLHAERSDGTGHRTYDVDKMAGLGVTTTPFQPRYAIEFSSQGPLYAPLQSRSTADVELRRLSGRSRRATLMHLYRCIRCGKEFRHSRRNATLRAHKDPYGHPCSGRRGSYMGAQY